MTVVRDFQFRRRQAAEYRTCLVLLRKSAP